MKYLQGWHRCETGSPSDRFAVHAVDESTMQVFTYSQELKAWHYDRWATDCFYDPQFQQSNGDLSFRGVPRDQVYGLVRRAPKLDLREKAMRRESQHQRGQVRRSGQVLTSAEVGLLTKPLKQRPATMPMLKELLETRSRHKRWTALFLYEEDGPTRRKAMSTLRNNGQLNVSSKGMPLHTQHRKRRFEIDGELHSYVAVEAKYVRATEQKWIETGGHDD